MNDIYVLGIFYRSKVFHSGNDRTTKRSDISKHSLERFIAVELFRLKSNWSVDCDRGGVAIDR